MADPENIFLWFEDREHYIKRCVSLSEFVVMVAEQIKRGDDKRASSKAPVKQQATSSERKK
jgi:hypothetical protein